MFSFSFCLVSPRSGRDSSDLFRFAPLQSDLGQAANSGRRGRREMGWIRRCFRPKKEVRLPQSLVEWWKESKKHMPRGAIMWHLSFLSVCRPASQEVLLSHGVPKGGASALAG